MGIETLQFLALIKRNLPILVIMAFFLSQNLAWAEFRVCNKTNSRIGLAIGVKEGPIFITQGWFNLKANSCETPIKEDLKSGPYYLYGVDYDRGGEWSGRELLCVGDHEFYVEDNVDCYARGYERAGFRRINTNNQKNWTLDIIDDATPLPAGVAPGLPRPPTTGQPTVPGPLDRSPARPSLPITPQTPG